MRISRSLAALVLPALCAGCGGPSVAPVSGTVTLDGKPLANAVVIFQPRATDQNINPGPGSEATTDAEGKYALKVVGTGQNGAVVGKHRVEIWAVVRAKEVDPASDAPQPAGKNLVPAKYNDKTTLEMEVPSGGTKTADFELKSR